MMEVPTEKVISFLDESFPDAKCSLAFSSPFECLVAVMLSAQTTDESVNKITPNFFRDFPSAFELAQTDIALIENDIYSLGLYRNKAKNLLLMAKKLVELYSGEVPNDKAKLVCLPGVGNKTANVVLAECFKVPSFPVDTHVGRIAKRLGYARSIDSPDIIEKKLEKIFPREQWIALHHRFIAFGRAICHSQNPDCLSCPLNSYCPYFKKASSKTGK